MPSKIEKKQKAAKLRKPPRDFSYTQNRELSWLRFDNRVLDEAFDETVPLFERLKFVSIFESNLDEFLMVRVGGLSDLAELKKQPVDNKSNMTASEQVDAVMAEMPRLLTRWESIFKSIEGKLDALGVHRARIDSLTPRSAPLSPATSRPTCRRSSRRWSLTRATPSPTCATAHSI